MRRKMTTVLVLLSILFSSYLTGCEKLDIEYTKTDRNYYKTHTGTENTDPVLPRWEKSTEVANKADGEDIVSGEITNCILRTGVETPAYAEASSKDKKITIPANMTFEILEMDNGYFNIEYDGTKLWLPSKNCLINAKQYIPSIEVDLGLSHSPNFFNIGGEDIKGLTEKQLYKRDGSIDGSEMWLRYEVAVKLLKAEEMFEKDGYRIKVADAYRPYSTTVTIRDGLNDFLKTTEGQELRKKYFGGYGVGSFLAQTASAHNYGVAVDMTLVDIESGEELSMPAGMHTLDASSAYDTWRGQSDAETSHGEYMRGIMSDCGFSPLSSEWWHFQVDNVERVQFDIPN